MKKKPYLTNYGLLGIGLAITVILVSVILLERTTILSAAMEMLRVNTVTPTPGPPKYYLVCPVIPNSAALPFPARYLHAPYDEELGDCALIGKSEEIDAWLTELEQIAASCNANRETNWAGLLAVRDNLDSQVDELDEPEEEGDGSTSTSPEEDLAELLTALANAPPGETNAPSDSIEPEAPQSHYYTDWLMRIEENVWKYCTMINELVKPLWQACDEINYLQDCCAPDPELYHSLIEWEMAAAQINYNNTEAFYTNSLQTYGWGNFRMYFNEAYIDYNLCEPASPMFTFSDNTYCHKGPSLDYEDVTEFLQRQSVQIDGRSQDEPRWWWVLIPDSSGHCWVPGSTGSAAGPLEGVDVVAALPLTPTPTLLPFVFIPNSNPYCYSGPDQSFSKIGVAMKGVSYLLDGSNLARDWFRIMLTPSSGCWVPYSSGSPSRDPSGLRILVDIPTNTSTPVSVVCTGLNIGQCSLYQQCKWVIVLKLPDASYCTNK